MKTRKIAAMAFYTLLAASPAYAADTDQTTPDQSSPAVAAPDQAAPPTEAPAAAPATDKGVEARIKHLHDQLKITSDQESLWAKVAQVMRDNARTTSSIFKERHDKSDTMSALDDIRSYQAMVAAHADGLGKLADAFEPLYNAMPEAQQKNADKVFGHIKHDHKSDKKAQ